MEAYGNTEFRELCKLQPEPLVNIQWLFIYLHIDIWAGLFKAGLSGFGVNLWEL